MQRLGGSEKRRTDGVKTMPGSHVPRNTIHQNGEGNADFITIRASCKTLQVANQHGLLSPLEDRETKSFGGLLRFSPNLPNSEPPSGKSKERLLAIASGSTNGISPLLLC